MMAKWSALDIARRYPGFKSRPDYLGAAGFVIGGSEFNSTSFTKLVANWLPPAS